MIIDTAFINLAFGLLILIIVNIVLGSIGAIFSKKFDFRFFLKGIGKAIIVIAATIAIYFVGVLNPEIVAIDLGGEQLTVISATHTVVLGAWFLYGKQVFEKLTNILVAKDPTKEQDEQDEQEPQEEDQSKKGD
jgi:hypothetical protein